MKRLPIFCLSLLLISLLQTGCRRDDDEVIPTDECYISANVDGQDYRWELNNCALNNQMLRVGNIASDEAELTIEPISDVGTFLTTSPDLQITFFLTLGPALQIIPGDVEIQVTTFSNTEARGTFEGVFTDIGGTNYLVANGEFRATY